MKKYALYTLLLALACVIMPVSAQTYVLTSVAERGSSYLRAGDAYFGTAAEERLVEVNTNVDFTVKGGASWCKVEKVEGAVKLTVASKNKKALALYESLGFVKTKEISKWYIV